MSNTETDQDATQPQGTTQEFWAGEFGDDYLRRNVVDHKLRIPFFRRVVEATNANAFLEVGCNRGHNLQALRHVAPEAMMSGVDVNEKAIEEAQAIGFDAAVGSADDIVSLFGRKVSQLTFTCGVLIHVAPENLKVVMQAIVDVTSDYVLAVEYEADKEAEVLYRGLKGRLWKRPFGKLYEEMGLSLVETGRLGPNDGFDDVTYWLLEVPR